MTVGIEMAASIAIGYGIGWWMDDSFGTSPWLLVVWVLVGIAAGFRSLYRVARRHMDETKRQGS